MPNDDKYSVLNSFDAEYANEPEKPGWRQNIYRIIFESETKKGKLFDIILVIFILTNILAMLLESVQSINEHFNSLFKILDKIYLVFFTIEVALRIICTKRPRRYIFSFYGMIDLLSILPTYLEHFIPETHVLMLLRSFRLLRIFRIFRLVGFLNESKKLLFAMVRSLRKILIFLFFVLLLTIFLGSCMYLIESKENPGFNNIPQSIYWAIVTITTVGYGDVAPMTAGGKVVASFIMILGYAIIAVPTGIVSSTMMQEHWKRSSQSKEFACPVCKEEGHDQQAVYCKHCGSKLESNT